MSLALFGRGSLLANCSRFSEGCALQEVASVAMLTISKPAWACLLVHSPEAAWILRSEKTAVLPERRLDPQSFCSA